MILQDQMPDDILLPYVMTFKPETIQYVGLEKHKVRCAIRGHKMRPEIDFDETRIASHMP